MVERPIETIQWRRSGVSDHDFMRRWTLVHWFRTEDGHGSDRTLCGLRIPWLRVGAGDSNGKCQRCAARAQAEGIE